MCFFDEGRFGLKPTVGRYWSKRGVRPIVSVEPRYKNFYVYSAVSPTTGESFSLFLPWVNTDMMNFYLSNLSKSYMDKSILLIMDQAGWHKSERLNIPNNIEIVELPPYSPDLNPVEKLWLWLKRHACRNHYFEKEETLMDEVERQLRKLTLSDYKRLCGCSYLGHYK